MTSQTRELAPPHGTAERGATGLVHVAEVDVGVGADSHVAVVGEGGQLARARVHDEGTGVRIDFEVPTAPVPPRLEAELVHAVFELGALRARRPLLATVPSGASQVLEEVRRHVADCRTRVAGSTCLVQGVVR